MSCRSNVAVVLLLSPGETYSPRGEYTLVCEFEVVSAGRKMRSCLQHIKDDKLPLLLRTDQHLPKGATVEILRQREIIQKNAFQVKSVTPATDNEHKPEAQAEGTSTSQYEVMDSL